MENLAADSQATAAVLTSNQRKFTKNPFLKLEYLNFMKEYSLLNHKSRSDDVNKVTFLRHHAVRKTDPVPKLRVVFNASHTTQTEKSLNDCLLAGAKLQADLWTVITRARFFQVFFTADIVKMFRQFLVGDEDTIRQKILWRSSESNKMPAYILDTVTTHIF